MQVDDAANVFIFFFLLMMRPCLASIKREIERERERRETEEFARNKE
jgi:hypothetical protein